MAKWIETMPDDYSASSSSEEEEEEEALSLCDLPNKTMTADNLDEESPLVDKEDSSSEFEFVWWGSNNYTNNINNDDSQMCAADDLFFNGQILPLRHSLSSDTPFLRSMSRSDSLDDSSVTRFIGSRSSSIGSHYSSASSSNSSSINSNYYYNNNIPTTRRRRCLPLQKPQFPIHHPIEAKPQTINNAANHNTQHRQSNPKTNQQPPYGSKSTVWDLFRTGLVRGPEIHLRSNLRKLPSKNGDVTTTTTSKKSSRRQGFFHRIGAGGGFLSGGSCKCSVDTVVPTTTEIVPTGNNGGAGGPHSKDEGTLLLHYSKSSTVMMMRRENGKKEKVKDAMSRRRASEWLKDLSLSQQSSSSSSSTCRTRSSNESLGKRIIARVP